MSQFVPLCYVTAAPKEGEVCEMAAAGRIFCVSHANGELIVMDNVCPHRGGPLGQGLIENGYVVCPWHAWAFNLKTGCASNNSSACARIYATRVENDVVLVDLEQESSSS